jgi:protein TonB
VIAAAHPRRRAIAIAAAIVIAVAAHLALAGALADAVARGPAPTQPPAIANVAAEPPPVEPEHPHVSGTAPARSGTRSSAASTTPPAARPPLPAAPLPPLAPLPPVGDFAPAVADAPVLLPAIAAPAAGDGEGAALGDLVSQGELDRPVRVRSLREPRFPPRAFALGLSDVVVVRFTVGVDGRAHDLEVVHSEHPEHFAEPTLAAIRAATFDPGERARRAVPATCLWTVRYAPP